MAVKTDTYGLDVVFNTKDGEKSMTRLGTVTDKATQRVERMVKAKGYLLYSLKRIVAYSAIFSFFGMLIKMLGNVISLELALAEVNTLIDKTNQDAVDSYNQVTQALLQLDPHLGNAIELTKGLYEIISAGVTDPAQAFELLQVSARYAKVGLTDLATAASSLTAVMKAYGFTAEAMRGKSDVLFAAVREGKFHTDELNAAIGKVLPTAAAMNVSVEEISAALAIMTQRGLDVNEAATSLNRMLITFLRPMDKAKKEFSKLGWTWGRNAFEGIGLIGVMKRLEVASKRYGELLPTIFRRQRALRGAFILQGAGLLDLEEMYGRIQAATYGAGIVQREYKEITKTVSEEMKALYASIIQAFSALLKHKGVVAGAIRQLAELLVTIVKNVPALMRFAAAIFLVKKAILALNTQFIKNIMVNRLAAQTARAFNVAMVDMVAVNRAAAISAQRLQVALGWISIALMVAAGLYLLIKNAIDKKNKADKRQIEIAKEHKTIQDEINMALSIAAEAYHEVTGEIRNLTGAATDLSRIKVYSHLTKEMGKVIDEGENMGDALEKMMKQQEVDLSKYKDEWIALRSLFEEGIGIEDALKKSFPLLDFLAKQMGFATEAAEEIVSTMKKSSPEFRKLMEDMTGSTRKLARDIRLLAAEFDSLPEDLARRFSAEELRDFAEAIGKVKEGIDPRVIAQLKAYGIDAEKLAKDEKALDKLSNSLRVAQELLPGIQWAMDVEDFQRAYEAAMAKVLYTSTIAEKSAEALYYTWTEYPEKSTEAFKIWAASQRKEIEKILATAKSLPEHIRKHLEAMAATWDKSVDDLEKIREKYQKISKKIADDQEKIASKITQLQNEYLGDQYKNILEQFKRESIAYKNRADEKLELALKSGVDILTAQEEHAKSMLQIQEWGQEAAKVSQYRALKERLDEFKETLNHMQQNTQQRIDTTHVMAEEAIKFLHTLGIEDEAFMELLEGVISKYFEKIRVETEAGRDAMQEYIKFFRSLATSLGFISDTLNDLAESMGTQGAALKKMAELFSIAADAVDGFAKGLKTFKEAEESLTGLAATLGKIAGILAIVVASFKLGWELGKFIKGLFGGDTRTEAEKTAAALARSIAKIQKALEDLGDVSDEVAEKIYDLVKQGIPEYVAVAMSLVDLMNDTGISMENFEKYLGRMIWALGIGTTAMWNMEEATEVLGEAFSKMLEYAKKMGIEGHKALLDFMKKAKELGYEIKEIKDYIESQLSMAAEGLYKMIKWVAQDAVDAWNAMKDLNKEKKKLMNQMARYQRQMDAAEEGSKAWLKAKERVDELYEAILDLDKELAKHQDVLNNVGTATERQLKRLGVITAAVFNAMWAEGVPMLEIFNKMGDAVFALMDRYKALGLEVPKYLQPMFKQFKLFRKYPEFFEGLQGLQQALEGLANSGYLTQDAFRAIYQEAKRYFDLLTRAKSEGGMGLGDEQAIGMMYPLLQKMWWYAQQYDLKLPKSIRDLIDQAKNLGFKFEKPVLERQLDAIDRLNDRMVWHRKGLRDQLLDTNRWLEKIYNKGELQHGSTGVSGGLAFLHKGESVIPENVTTALKRFFVGGGSIGESGGGGMLEAHIYIDGEKTYKALVPHIRKGGAYADFEVDGIGVR